MTAPRPRHHLVTLQRRTTEQDTAGQTIESWSALRQEWASIEPVRAAERFVASGELADVSHQMRVYYGSGVLPRDRVVYGSRVFDIKTVINEGEANKYLQLLCVEVLS